MDPVSSLTTLGLSKGLAINRYSRYLSSLRSTPDGDGDLGTLMNGVIKKKLQIIPENVTWVCLFNIIIIYFFSTNFFLKNDNIIIKECCLRWLQMGRTRRLRFHRATRRLHESTDWWGKKFSNGICNNRTIHDFLFSFDFGFVVNQGKKKKWWFFHHFGSHGRQGNLFGQSLN